MRIHRSHPAGQFTVIPNETLRDARLSYAARGVLAEILSRPDDWSTTADQLWHRARHARGKAGEGRNTMRALFTELEAAGYVHRQRYRAHHGRMVTETHVFDAPVERLDDGMPVVLAAEQYMSAGHSDARTSGPRSAADARTSGPRPDQAERASSQAAPTPGPPGVGPPGVGGTGVLTKTEDEDRCTKTFDGNLDDENSAGSVLNSSVEGIGNGHVKSRFDVTAGAVPSCAGRPDGLTDEQWAEIAWLGPASRQIAAEHARRPVINALTAPDFAEVTIGSTASEHER